MRAAAFAVLIGSLALMPGAAKAQAADPAARCVTIRDQQSRDNCFAQAGVPVIHCSEPKDADDAAFCREMGYNPNGVQANTGQGTSWWCDASQSYYPSVMACATPWRAVAIPSPNRVLAAPHARLLPVKKSGPITDCDRYAASPVDPEHLTVGVPIEKLNPDLAIPACESAVRQHPDDPRLLYQLGRAYYKANNFAAALQQNLKAANLNYAPAQYNLAIMYFHGKGVAQDYAEAAKWYQKAANQGEAQAQSFLGFLYYSGFGVRKDYTEAMRWQRAAAEQGNALAESMLGAMYYSGQGVPKNYAEAMRWFLGAAEQGNAVAQSILGDMYYYAYGVPQNYVEAGRWWSKAADQGNVSAENNLGVMYANGNGVPKDYALAVKWYRLAAEQGNAVAEDSLGFMYSKGYGVPQDFAEAEKWWNKAADQGNASAQTHLATLNVRTAQERGYRRISFDDFKLDGKDLAADQAKLSMQGIYVKEGQMEFLFPSLVALQMARETINVDAGVGLLTEDATRSLRKLLLDCENNPVGAQAGCPVTVLGHASMCTRTTLVGSTNVPCLVVEDGAAFQ